MWCDIDPEELSAFIDGEVTPERSAALGAHVSACQACRSELERARQSDDAIRRGVPEPALLPLRADLVKRVGAIRTRARLRNAVAAAAIAAAFLVGVRLVDFGGNGANPSPPPSLVLPPAPAIEALELDAASLRLALVADAPDPAVRRGLDARLDAIVNRIGKLRSHN